MPQPEVVIYTRPGCGLCEEAAASVRKLGFEPRMVDISGESELEARFGLVIPVVVVDGVERFRGRVSPVLLRRELRGADDAGAAP